jgi:site-specific recombinase XerD
MGVADVVTLRAQSPGMEPLPQPAGLATFDLLRAWRDWMEHSGKFSERTRTQYLRCMTRFLADVLVPLEELTEADVIAYLDTMPGKGGMRGQIIRTLKCFYRYAVPRKLVPFDPTWDLDVPRRKYGEAPSLTDEELERVFQMAAKLDRRARPTLELMYATGARVGSICEVLPEEVNLVRQTIFFRVAKGDRPYTNPLGPRGMRAALKLLELRDYSPPRSGGRRPTLVGVASPIVQRWAKEAGEMAGVHVWTHLLRHTFAERIANDPAVPELVWTELMNHRDGALIRRYASARLPLKRDAVAGL